MGSATYPLLGSKYPDHRNVRGHGEKMYVRGGAAAYGDVKMAGLLLADAAVDDEKPFGSADSLMANVEPVSAGTSDVNLRFADFRVCNDSAVIDDAQGAFLGEQRCWAKVKINIASNPTTITAGTPFVATAGQVYVTAADLGQDGHKVIALAAKDQTFTVVQVDYLEVLFDGKGFGEN